MKDYSLSEIVSHTSQDLEKIDFFELETSRILKVNLTEYIWAKVGAMVTYTGKVRFQRERVFEHGVRNMFKRTFTGEGFPLMKATGKGHLYLADEGKKIIVFDLEDKESITVNGNDLLAFEPTIRWNVRFMRRIGGMMAGGLFNIHLKGPGKVAITTHFDPVTFQVRPNQPVFTDPNATVAWSGHLKPKIHTDVTMRTFLGRGSGESIQLKFTGEGFVMIHPYEKHRI